MFSIITPAYNNPAQLAKLLDSIRPEVERDLTLEVIVVDDGSTGDSVKDTTAGYAFARYTRMGTNSGPAAARNEGARLAKNDILLFLDSDVIVNSDTISKIRDAFRKDISITALCGEYDIEPANPSFAARFKALMARSWIPKEDRITVFVARIGAIRKSVFETMGGFDAGIKTASIEEWEFGRRLINNGYTIRYDPAIAARHHFPDFGKQLKLFFHRTFMWFYVFKRYGGFDNTCTTPGLAITQVFGSLTALFLLLSIVNMYFLYPAAGLLTLFMIGSRRFFRLTLEREGLIFTLGSIPLGLVLACSIVLGGVMGALYYFPLTFFLSPFGGEGRVRGMQK